MPPKQVTVSCVHLSSYGFLQTPPLASDALAIRIIFPLVGVIRLLSAYRVCQLRWANKKGEAMLPQNNLSQGWLLASNGLKIYVRAQYKGGICAAIPIKIGFFNTRFNV